MGKGHFGAGDNASLGMSNSATPRRRATLLLFWPSYLLLLAATLHSATGRSDPCLVRTHAGNFDIRALQPRVEIQSKGWTFHTSACANLSAPEEFCQPPAAGNDSAVPVWAISPDSSSCFAVGNLATGHASYDSTNQSLTITYTSGTPPSQQIRHRNTC